ncbi:hypothetical protein CN178_33325, partial [Sinorhizobium medicae]
MSDAKLQSVLSSLSQLARRLDSLASSPAPYDRARPMKAESAWGLNEANPQDRSSMILRCAGYSIRQSPSSFSQRS